ncbi:3'-5' exonuclease, partial [Candidatus Gottesmanbacteria bacterium]|nr:3'-5' exonuclease [Candidatus Gottesmanbacteria bacterium]
MVHPECYISVDVEAAGPIPWTYSLLSIGACVVGSPEQSFYSELVPINDAFVAEAMVVHGFSLEKLKQAGEAPAAAMARFEQWILQVSDGGRPVFVAFNATFDWMFVHWY